MLLTNNVWAPKGNFCFSEKKDPDDTRKSTAVLALLQVLLTKTQTDAVAHVVRLVVLHCWENIHFFHVQWLFFQTSTAVGPKSVADLFRATVPFRGQTSQIPSNFTPKTGLRFHFEDNPVNF